MEKKDFKVKVNKVSVLYRTILFFIGFLVILVSLGFAPKGVKEINNAFFSIFIHDERSSVNEGDLVETVRFGSYTEPARIVIPKIGVDAKVLNPKSSDTEILDDALLYGAVRYPESGDLESNQTIFIFGHSSHLPIVHNQNFKLFSEIPKYFLTMVVTRRSSSYTEIYASGNCPTRSSGIVYAPPPRARMFFASGFQS
jgi:hypothetical protein